MLGLVLAAVTAGGLLASVESCDRSYTVAPNGELLDTGTSSRPWDAELPRALDLRPLARPGDRVIERTHVVDLPLPLRPSWTEFLLVRCGVTVAVLRRDYAEFWLTIALLSAIPAAILIGLDALLLLRRRRTRC